MTIMKMWKSCIPALACVHMLIATSAAQESLIKNGNMSALDSQKKPAGWLLNGSASLSADTDVNTSAPTALRIDLSGTSGGAYQSLSSLPTGPITIKGSARAEGTFTMAQIALQAFDSNGKQTAWKIITFLKPGSTWTPFEKTVQLPPNSVSATLDIIGNGTGRLWADDLEVTPGSKVPVTTGSSAASTPAAQELPEAAPLPLEIPADNSLIHYIGRFDTTDPKAPACAWSASTISFCTSASAANVKLTGKTGNRWQVFVDGKPTSILSITETPKLYNLFKDAPAGNHAVSLVKCTESNVGITKFLGLQLPGGASLSEVPTLPHRIEVIGDSISAGFGNEAKNQYESFSPLTENASIAYGALTARKLNAEFVDIAWSGKTMWPKNTLPELYDRIIPQDPASKWDFSHWQPEVVVINLCTNDFIKGNPEEEEWVHAYEAFIARVRGNYPHAFIFCALGPMLSDNYSASKSALSTARKYLNRIVDESQKAGDQNIAFVEFPMQTGSNGFGAKWHPSAKQHQAMAAVLEKAIQEKLGWKE